MGTNPDRESGRFRSQCRDEERVAEITSLGLTYGLLTRYTSFIAVHEIVRRTTEGADDVDQPLPLPAGVSDRAVGVTSGAEPELVWVSAMVLALFGCARLLRARGAGARGSRRVKTKLCVLAVAALVIWGMKRHYADARADDLWWILSPTAQLVGVMTGATFVAGREKGISRASVCS